jgi:hypothetical protein
MKIHPNRKLMFLISCLVILTVVSGCTVAPTLEEKSTLPVFNDMNVLGSKYCLSLIFPPSDTSSFLFPHPGDYLTFKPAELSLNSCLPVVPDKLIAYKVIRPVVNETYARDLMRRIGFSSGTFGYNGGARNYYIYTGDGKSPSPSMTIDKDGKIDVLYSYNRSGASGCADQEAIDAARNWLQSRGLYPKGNVNIKTTREELGFYKDAPEGITFWSTTGATVVIFSPTLDGHELFGIGALFFVADNAKILEVHINMPELQPYCYVKLQQPEVAFATLRDYLQNPSKFGADAPECVMGGWTQNIQVNNVSLEYFVMEPADTSQPAYAQPVYVTYGKTDKPEWLQDAYILLDAVAR